MNYNKLRKSELIGVLERMENQVKDLQGKLLQCRNCANCLNCDKRNCKNHMYHMIWEEENKGNKKGELGTYE